MDYFDNDDDDWIFDVPLPGETRVRESEMEDEMGDEDDSWMVEIPIPGEKRRREPEEEEMSGGQLFEFELQEGEMPRRWRNIVHKTRHKATLRQTGETRDGDHLGDAMSEAVRRALVAVVTRHPNLNDRDAIHFTMRSNAFAQQANHCFQSCQFRVEEIGDDDEDSSPRFGAYMDQLAKQLNSSQSFAPGDDFSLEVTTIRMPEEGGRRKKHDIVKGRVRNIHKRCRVAIQNDDNLCCLRAVVTMRAWADKLARRFPPAGYRALREGSPQQKVQAIQLGREAGVSITEPLGLEDLTKIQAVLTPRYQIKVLQIGLPHMIVFAGPKAPSLIMLVLEDGHYDGTTSFKGMFNRSYFCPDCDRGYDNEDMEHHPCDGRRCKACHELECADWLAAKERTGEGHFIHPTTPCVACHRDFFGPGCIALHRTAPDGKKSQCQQVKKCPKCCKVYWVEFNPRGNRTTPPHRCGYAACEHCEKTVDLYTHQCFIQKVKKSEDDPKTKRVPRDEVGERTPLGPPKNGMVEVERQPPLFVYADFEATTCAEGYQTAIMVGYETSESDECHTLYGEGVTGRFLADLETLAVDDDGDDRSVIVVFHNLKGYDGMLLLRYLYAQHREVTGMVTVGAKVLSFTSDRLTFKDSLCFLPFSLASFPATFGITELCKGFFPHQFNTLANQEYVGPMPDPRHYDPEGMTTKKRDAFVQWHATQVASGYVFNLKEDMARYCKSDVKLLKAGCRKFVSEFKEQADFDPLEKCLTIASACNRYWRKVQLIPKSVALQPFNGWKVAQPLQSMQARQWLSYKNHRLRGDDAEAPDVIRHAFNGGEVRVEGMLVDGADTQRRIAYEYNGCFFHGCLTCFPHQRLTTTSRRRGDRTFQECYETTVAKKKRLEAAGWQVETMWECRWKNDVKRAEGELAAWLANWNPVSPLEPRDAFFGGRTNAVKLHHACGEGEKILYQDVTSLYPWVNKYALYPTGHPHVITTFDDPADLKDYFGVMKLTILPPRGLYHPVLPLRQGGKLTFPLCRTCVEVQMALPMEERTWRCNHGAEQRQLTGTWCSPEVREAVRRGYVVVKLHEVWHFPQNQQKFGLFRDYVNTWLKNKTEASGYPHWADTPEKKNRYVTDYATKEGIHLEPAKIEKNPGRKATAKLMLNSFWDKFGENLRKSSTQQVTNPAELYEIITDPLKEVTGLRIYSEDVMEIVFSAADDECVKNGKTNIFVAAFTTCHARLKLYKYLDAMQERVLYFDTDSVIYSQQPGQSALPLGDFLGDLTNEVDHDDHIVDFTSGGPKNYGYKTANGKVECKVRGFSLGSVRGHAQLNYERLRQNVLEELVDPQDQRRSIPVTNPYFFTRDAATKRLRVMPRTKSYGLVFDKRVVDRNTFKSYPYGYA